MPGIFFVTHEYETPAVVDAIRRIASYGEGTHAFSPLEAKEAAGRCISCAVPGCNDGCPLGQKIPDFLRAAYDGDWHKAHEIAGYNSPLYGIFGDKICPKEGLCEANCTVAKVHTFAQTAGVAPQTPFENTIAIGAVEHAIWRHTIDQNGGLRYPTPVRETGKSVAIIGAGPAGIYAAHALRAKGHAVTVVDAQDEIGGLLLRGIPSFKVEKKDLPIVREAMEKAGIKFQLNTRVGAGEGVTLQELRAANDAVMITIGTQQANTITHPDTGKPIDGHEHIIPALDFLWAHGDHQRLGATLDARYQVAGRRIAIFGAGDTAMDGIGTSAREGGASELKVVVRSKIRAAYKEQSMRNEEAAIAIPGGADYMMQTQTLGITRDEDGLVLRMRDHEGAIKRVVVDMAVNATGFAKPNLAEMFGMDIRTVGPDREGRTNIPGIFAAGDVHRSDLAVTAAAAGRRVAGYLHRSLG